ncbi:DUF559 domain-containing protein [Luteococcus sp. H138]|uniref:endonuclease domain-containing protein n=1 Tax=unclassified Luteococcus TaxID=2639923 RepID=UPI00313ADD7E
MLTALRSAWRCLDEDNFIAAVDSVVHHKLATLGEVRAALGGIPRAEQALDRCDRAESGTETFTRLRLRSRKVQLRTQVQIGEVGRVDLLVGERLIIEVDSKAHHTGEENYAKDRERDLELRALGYIVVRLTYEQVMFGWATVEQSLLAMIRRGDHWWGARRGLKAA